MATHRKHNEVDTFYFVTFTCYKWLPLIQETSLYDHLSGQCDILIKNGISVCGYVFMPNHVHLLLHLDSNAKNLNRAIGDIKRFTAYEIVKRLTKSNRSDLLTILQNGVQREERSKGKQHQVFRLSFDAKEVCGNKEFVQVLDYIHGNPVSGKWNLVSDFVDYPYSSAGFYELNQESIVKVTDYRDILYSESLSGDSEG